MAGHVTFRTQNYAAGARIGCKLVKAREGGNILALGGEGFDGGILAAPWPGGGGSADGEVPLKGFRGFEQNRVIRITMEAKRCFNAEFTLPFSPNIALFKKKWIEAGDEEKRETSSTFHCLRAPSSSSFFLPTLGAAAYFNFASVSHFGYDKVILF